MAIGLAERDGERFYNTAVLIDHEGGLLLSYRKTHLYESDLGVFKPGAEFPVCRWNGIRVGLLICFDIEFPETARMLANKGAEIILVLDGMMKPHGHVHRRVVPVRPWKTRSMCSWPIGWARATGTRSAAKARWPIRSGACSRSPARSSRRP